MPSRLFPCAFLVLFATTAAISGQDFADRLSSYRVPGVDTSVDELTLGNREPYGPRRHFPYLDSNRYETDESGLRQPAYYMRGHRNSPRDLWPISVADNDMINSQESRRPLFARDRHPDENTANESDNPFRRSYIDLLKRYYTSPISSRQSQNYPNIEGSYRGPKSWHNEHRINNQHLSHEDGWDPSIPLKSRPVYPFGQAEVPEDTNTAGEPAFTYSERVPSETDDKVIAVPPSSPRWNEKPFDRLITEQEREEDKTEVDRVEEQTEKVAVDFAPTFKSNFTKVIDEDEDSLLGAVSTEAAAAAFVSPQRRAKEVLPDESANHHINQEALAQPIINDNNQNIYFIAVVAGCSAAAMFILVLISLTWCRLRRGAKAAADVEYPAYGVTGPNKDTSPSGDRRLAQSAQMYHYQHQKQQIIAMENRNATAREPGSLSEAESDEENEEGDYTVYECPGLAPTGEMEVKNPLFHDDPTPATPAQTNRAADHM